MSYADSLWYTWFAPHLHDKRKERKKESNETKQENFCGGESSFVRA
jgi:hypothetical protein